mmetsp:Transcript_15788/g.34099  ORF Transcript_15788/g.34099 Transcript_15788/m.34099 type:complete len:267 (+) Transcript_15788:109-909(+)
MPKLDANGEEIKRIPLLLVSKEESIDSPLDRRSEAYRHIAQKIVTTKPVPPVRQPIMTIPNILTFFRLLLVPVLLLLWEIEWRYTPILCAVVFILASLTDWLDGMLARKLKIATVFGAFLDPVADKIMVSTALVLLTITPPPPITTRLMALPVIIMICREVTMSALREWAAAAGGAAHKAVKVNSFGKWKTALQMVSMSILLVARQPISDYAAWLPPFITEGPAMLHIARAAFICLWAATALAVWSVAVYMANVWTHFIYPQVKQQ